MNSITVSGRLGQDPSVHKTKDDATICKFSLAVREFSGGEEKTMWVNIVSFGKTAEFVSTYAAKGDYAFVQGRLSIRKYEAQDGTNRYATEIIAERVEIPKNTKKENTEENPPF